MKPRIVRFLSCDPIGTISALPSFWETITAGPGGAPSLFRSSDYSSRAFCPACGSSIGAVDDDPVMALLLGCFDKPLSAELMPTSHSYRDGRPGWWHVEETKRDVGAP